MPELPLLLQVVLVILLMLMLYGVGSFLTGNATLQQGWEWVFPSALTTSCILAAYSLYLTVTGAEAMTLIATALIMIGVLFISQITMNSLPPWVRHRRLHWTRKR